MDAISSAIPPTVEGVEAPDDDLARRAGSDSRAMEALYLRHHLTIFRYLRARCRDDETAMDLTAVTFEKAMRSIARYAPRGSGFPAWLLRIARNGAIDEERRRRPLLAGGWHALTQLRSQGPDPKSRRLRATSGVGCGFCLPSFPTFSAMPWRCASVPTSPPERSAR